MLERKDIDCNQIDTQDVINRCGNCQEVSEISFEK